MKKRYLLIKNPASGKGKSKLILSKIEKEFEKKDALLDIYFTKSQGDAINAARKADHDVVIACGGDGTVNEVVNGLIQNKLNPVLGVIPLGTENVFAQEFKIPANPAKAAELIIKGKPKKMDVGKAKGRYFTLMAGIGFDAHVASKIQPMLKNLLGRAVYPFTAWNEFFKYKHKELSITIDKKIKVKGSYVVVGNTKLYGANLRMTYHASTSDGKLDVCIFKGKNIFEFVKFAFGVFAKYHDIPEIEYHKAKEVYVHSKQPVLCHVDCELIGTTPLRIKAVPKAIRVIGNK